MVNIHCMYILWLFVLIIQFNVMHITTSIHEWRAELCLWATHSLQFYASPNLLSQLQLKLHLLLLLLWAAAADANLQIAIRRRGCLVHELSLFGAQVSAPVGAKLEHWMQKCQSLCSDFDWLWNCERNCSQFEAMCFYPSTINLN